MDFQVNLTLKMDVLRSGKEAAPASVNAARTRSTLVKIPLSFMMTCVYGLCLVVNEIKLRVS